MNTTSNAVGLAYECSAGLLSFEQERRSMRLLANGEFEAAEQQKLAIIQQAERAREAVIQLAQGKAEAIRLVNEAAEKYFIGNAQILKRMEMTENSLRENAKIVITENGVSPTLRRNTNAN